ncbi:TetR/AcrR family transcriptional regulator [Pendulispora rubella]|uniref:TetR/AcrR family transcriptional regulator n=1 Tax=Pendulispora rubella TaxID=2741070 RepID=A0ABZ2KTF1_9BACT
MGRPPNTRERRAQIVDALLTVMGREGYASATIAKIAREARLAPGLVHYHFENKEAILVEAFQTLAAQLEARATARIEAAGNAPREQLMALIDAYVAVGHDADPKAMASWVVFGAEAIRQPDVRKLYERALSMMFERTSDRVRTCLKESGRTTKNAGAIAAVLLSAIEGAYRIAVAAPGLMPAGYAAPTMRRMVDGLLSSEPFH